MDYNRITDKKQLQRVSCYNCEYHFTGCPECERRCIDGECFELRPELARLIELEDKIENGTLVELPCKVGDTFYGIQGNDCFAYCCYGFKYGWRRGEDDECYVLYALTVYEMEFVWGEEAFATEAEAEAKLKELQGGRK